MFSLKIEVSDFYLWKTKDESDACLETEERAVAVLEVKCTYTNDQESGCTFWTQDIGPSEESWPKPTLKGVLTEKTTLWVSPPERGSEARNNGIGGGGWQFGR